MSFDNLEGFFHGIFIEVIQNRIDVCAIEYSIDHLLLSPGIGNLLNAHCNLHERYVTDE